MSRERKSAFHFFMLDWKKQEEAKGRIFSNELKDVQTECSELWKNLTKQQKGPYKVMAKNDKIQSQIKSKKTSYGESIKMLQKEEEDKQNFIKTMEKNIKITVDTAINLRIMPNIKFCFMHVNWFFSHIVNNRVEYFPAEYALGVFSLEKGIEDVHHVIIGAKIPLGYRREASETSQNNHKIPLEDTKGETDFALMYKKLIDFLRPRKTLDKYPPIYTTKSYIKPIQSLLAKLCNAAEQDEEQFNVYELETLYIQIANNAYKTRKDREIKYIAAYARHIFTRLTYVFERNFDCSFHKFVETGSEYCSQSKLYQWAWTLCEEFCKSFEVKMYEGIHYPFKLDNCSAIVMHKIRDLKIDDQQPELENMVLSMSGVSENHKIKVSSRTYQDEIRRRQQGTAIKIIDYGQISDVTDMLVKESDNESSESNSNEWKLQSLYPDSYNSSDFAITEHVIPQDCDHFPLISERQVSHRDNGAVMKKKSIGRGKE